MNHNSLASLTSSFQAKEEGRLKRVFGDFYSPPQDVVVARISDEVKRVGGRVEDSTVIGFSAHQAGMLTRKLLENGQNWAVNFGQLQM
jgi:hypothetical protein